MASKNDSALRRGVWTLMALAAGAALLAGLLFMLRAPGPAPATASLPGVTHTLTATAAPPSTTPSAVEPADQTLALTDTVAVVNGQPISRQWLETIQSIDRVMLDLLGAPPDPNELLLDRLVNAALVQQAADTAGFQLDSAALSQALDSFLAGRGRALADLDRALADQGIGLDAFNAYWSQLLRADQFTRQQAQAQNVAVPDYLRSLQRAARISFGPAAALADRPAAQALSGPVPSPTDNALAGPTATPAATVAAALPPGPDVARGVNVGNLAPDFFLPVINAAGMEVASLEDLLGQPVVLSFFTTWCPYCRRQAPVVVDAALDPANAGIRFVGVDVGEAQAQVEGYIAELGIPYAVLLDGASQAAGSYQVAGFPTTYFLDSEGLIVARHIGQMQPDVLAQYLAQLRPLAGN